MKRPFLWFFLSLSGGIMLARYGCGTLPLPVSISFFAVFACFAVIILYLKFKQRIFFVLPVFAAIGLASALYAIHPKNPELEGIASRSAIVRINGVVTKASTNPDKTLSFDIKTDSIEYAGTEYKTRLKIYVRTNESTRYETRPVPGQEVTVTGKLNLLDFRRNPGAYDEFMQKRGHGVEYKLSCISITPGKVTSGPLTFLRRLNAKAGGVFDRALPEKEAGIMKAMILGDTDFIETETKRLYHDTGIYHILAISGLHVSLLAFSIKTLLKRLKFNERTASITAAAFLVIYCAFTGASVTCIRAVMMGCLLLLGGIAGREGDSVNTISFSALAILLVRPLYLWNFGFIYSFGAVCGLTVCTAPIRDAFFKRPVAKKYLPPVIAAALVTYPLNAYFFFDIPAVGLFANLITVPLMFITVLSGFLTLAAGFFGSAAAAFFSGPAYAVLNFYEAVCRISGMLPFSRIVTGRPPLPVILLFYITAAAFIYYIKADKNEAGNRKIFIAVPAAALSAAVLFFAVIPKPMELIMLDVGQGDCIAAVYGGQAVVIDGGGWTGGTEENTGVRVLNPYLECKGIDRVAAVFVTHPDIDHIMGIIELFDRKKVANLYLPEGIDESDGFYIDLMEKANRQGTRVSYLRTGDALAFRNGIGVRCVSPGESSREQTNERSLVLMLEYGGVSYLLTGDIGVSAEGDILRSGAGIGCDVLKVAHHGSKYSTSEEFLDGAAPHVALISASRNNPHGHPAPETMEKLEKRGIDTYVTAECGAVTLLNDGKTITVRKTSDNIIWTRR